MSEHRTFKYFSEETLNKTAEKFGWRLINDDNRKQLFLEMLQQMDMSYSYKPILIEAIFANADSKGRIRLAIREKLSEGVKSGVVWHTQGSGKTAS